MHPSSPGVAKIYHQITANMYWYPLYYDSWGFYFIVLGINGDKHEKEIEKGMREGGSRELKRT
jgi:hypothetical protein